MALLLAGFSPNVPGMTINRLCASGLEAVGAAARARSRRGSWISSSRVGVESMSRAPLRDGESGGSVSRANAEIYDTTIGWRFVNPVLKKQYDVDSMPETGENVAEEFQVSREDQDKFALRSQERAVAAQKKRIFSIPRLCRWKFPARMVRRL